MDEQTKEIWKKVKSGAIDINRQQLFFSIVAKGFIYKLNQNLQLRNISIPHYILNTGDDIMYLEVKGQNHAVEPIEVSNEDYVYSQIPRCMVQPAGINIQTDQLTTPYAHGNFQIEENDMVYNLRAEFRRMPITYTFSLKYYLDSFIDSLDVIQQIIANLAFINRFDVIYLGQKIECSYKVPDDYQGEFMMEFDGITTDSKARTISMELQVDTNMPIVYGPTVIPTDAFIKEVVLGTGDMNWGIIPGSASSGLRPGEFDPSDPTNPNYDPNLDPTNPDSPVYNPDYEYKPQMRYGIILHSKGTLNATKGELSDDNSKPSTP